MFRASSCWRACELPVFLQSHVSIPPDIIRTAMTEQKHWFDSDICIPASCLLLLVTTSSGTQLHPIVSSARIVNQTTMATSAHLKTCEQSFGSSQESNGTSSNTNINENHHGLNPRATPFTPHVPTKPSPTHQSQGRGHPTTQAAIPSKIEDLLSGKIENYVSRVRVQDDSPLRESTSCKTAHNTTYSRRGKERPEDEFRAGFGNMMTLERASRTCIV
jgi:hypothetical protein